MKLFLKAYWKTLLFFAVVGLLGGFLTGIYVLDNYPADIRQQLLEELNPGGLGQVSADILMGIISAIQSAGYGIVLGAVGIWLGKKIGLWKDERGITKRPLVFSIVIAVVGGFAMILSDILFFGQYSEAIMNSYATKPTIPYVLASITYGGVIEEVMLRLFWMSLIAFVLHKLFGKKHDKPTVTILVLANVIAAILFAAGHLPATAALIGFTPMIIVRCFLLNGGIGVLFGWLYRKYGLRYAMIAHGGCHVVSKILWILFI
ncbi:MAG: CPBP family intramembrane metalloprotease [Clostridia bacterium]|nr:CPBP family intramembrane metalloprotease [Clostridia bacterium]